MKSKHIIAVCMHWCNLQNPEACMKNVLEKADEERSEKDASPETLVITLFQKVL